MSREKVLDYFGIARLEKFQAFRCKVSVPVTVVRAQILSVVAEEWVFYKGIGRRKREDG